MDWRAKDLIQKSIQDVKSFLKDFKNLKQIKTPRKEVFFVKVFSSVISYINCLYFF